MLRRTSELPYLNNEKLFERQYYNNLRRIGKDLYLFDKFTKREH